MASSKEYINFVLEQCRGLTARAMMGEYVLYYRDKVIGGIYDDRLMVKNVPPAMAYVGEATLEPPYEGAKDMILVKNVDSREYLEGLFRAMVDELPVPKAKKTH